MKLAKLEIYMEMAHVIKKLSPDTETQVGSVMLSREGRVISTSFNGFVPGAPDKDLPNTRPGKYEYMVHSETNMLFNCCKMGIKTQSSTIVCTLSPCLNCLRAAYSAGVDYIIFDELYSQFDSVKMYEELEDIFVTVEKIGKYTELTLMEHSIKDMVR